MVSLFTCDRGEAKLAKVYALGTDYPIFLCLVNHVLLSISIICQILTAIRCRCKTAHIQLKPAQSIDRNVSINLIKRLNVDSNAIF